MFFFLLFFPSLVFGGNLPPLQLPYGGAGAASLKDDFSHFINPATLGFQNQSQVLLSYALDGEIQKGIIALQDRQGGFPMGLSYGRLWRKKGPAENKWSLSLAQPLGSYFSFGVNVHRDHLKPPWSGDVGLLFKPATKTALGVSLGNITVSKGSSQRDKVLTVGGYQEFGGFFSVRADASHLKNQGWLFKGGFETLFYNFFAVRVGGVWKDREKTPVLSGGGGFYGPRLQVEYGTQKDKRLWYHAFSAKLIF